MSKIARIVVLSVLATTAAGTASAGNWGWPIFHPPTHTPAAAPEIDPASAISGLTMLAGGLTVLRGRRKKQ
ncbi:MAG TPA: hypothetical protein VGM84_26650 [Steroidobacteraceae bacterium]|jgi:LPXTG-motif cell wall-anchored protein